MQQFAGRIYGPLIAHGIAWWHGAEGNYWGHNAMIRTRAFAAQAACRNCPDANHSAAHHEPRLRGGRVDPTRRVGIHMMPALAGSYEECPPGLLDLAVRDRRWCQGNLQHAGGAAGAWPAPDQPPAFADRHRLLHHRAVVADVHVGRHAGRLAVRFVQPDYFPAGKSLFPVWPIVDPVRAMWMFVGTMGLLLAPKLLGFVAVLMRGEDRRGCGGAIRLLFGVLIESSSPGCSHR